MTGRRRPLRLGHVLVTLEDLLILSWRVDAEALRSALPAGLTPLLHGGWPYLSVLMFRNVSLRPAILGFPSLSGPQLNIRSYIVDPVDKRRGSVFFHGFYPQPAWLSWVSARLFATPYGSLPFKLTTRQGSNGFEWRASSQGDAVSVRAQASADVLDVDDDLLDLLTNVHTGYVGGRGEGVWRTWSIWHRNQTLRAMDVEQARIAPLEKLGLGLGRPELAFYVEAIDYEVYLPARSITVVGQYPDSRQTHQSPQNSRRAPPNRDAR